MDKKILLVGEKFPEKKILSTEGHLNLPNDYKGSWLVLFCFPYDFDPVFTTEMVSFSRKIQDFKKLNCEVVAISMETTSVHIKWIEWINEIIKQDIPLTIASDSAGNMLESLGLITIRNNVCISSSYLIIDTEGIIRLISNYPVETGRSINEILRCVKSLQLSDKHNIQTPANWPENELLDDRVIIPPPADMKASKKRMNEHDGYDWWFCHKKI